MAISGHSVAVHHGLKSDDIRLCILLWNSAENKLILWLNVPKAARVHLCRQQALNIDRV